MKISRYFVISLFILLSCVPALYLPTEEQAEKAGIPLDDLKMGRKLYIDHCGSCHMLYLPKQFTVEKWNTEMDSMRTKTTITDLEEKQILDYLLAGK
ncbi:MAG: hypothetical protein IH596_09245 [Bacteroidales bacterium]|nr:hypothetical protein [Bacteroidales bacterium]